MGDAVSAGIQARDPGSGSPARAGGARHSAGARAPGRDRVFAHGRPRAPQPAARCDRGRASAAQEPLAHRVCRRRDAWSSGTRSACRPRAMSASMRSSRAVSRSSTRRAISVWANDSYANSASGFAAPEGERLTELGRRSRRLRFDRRRPSAASALEPPGVDSLVVDREHVRRAAASRARHGLAGRFACVAGKRSFWSTLAAVEGRLLAPELLDQSRSLDTTSLA